MHIAVLGPCTPKALAPYLDAAIDDLPHLTGTPVDGVVGGLLDQGHRVTLITTSPEVASTTSFSGERFQLMVVNSRVRARHRALDLFRHERRGLGAALRMADVDVIHAHWTYEFAWAGLADGRPLVITAHDSPFTVLRRVRTAYRGLRLVMAWRVRAQTRHLITVSPYLAGKWRRQMLYRRPITIIPNIAPFPPTSASPVDGPNLRILDIADPTPRKNVETLLQAFRLVRAAEPGAELTLVGHGLGRDGPVAKSHPESEGVTFAGWVDRPELQQILQRTTVFVHASLEESQPMCFLEAFAYGVPSIGGRDSGGVAWTLDDGRAGLLVNAKSAESIAKGVLRLHRDPALRQVLTTRATELLKKKYSPSTVSAAYLAEYEKALSHGRVR